MTLHLFIDADDTLWENNKFFEDAFSEFVDFLDHSQLTPSEVRAVLDEIEGVNNKIHGYGAANFARNLRECYERLAERYIDTEDLNRIMRFGEELARHPIEIIEGVEETLAYLGTRHRLTLCTKGHPEEQRLKIDRSGLEGFFEHIEIVREKDPDCYRALASDRRAEPETTWMIGNSPKSDINPAIEAGLGAVYVPHPRTWHLEHAPVPNGHQRLLVVDRFADLRRHF
jgi:putative hydrolase of the HAD superfamily